MAAVDLDEYYQAFDQIMESPDEPMEEFLKRKATHKQSFTKDASLVEIPQRQGWTFDSSLATQEPLPAIHDSRLTSEQEVPVEHICSSDDPMKINVRKSPELSLSLLLPQNMADQSISAEDSGPGNQLGENVQLSPLDRPVGVPIRSTTSPHRSSSPIRDEIESFTLGLIDAPLAKNSGKRKSTDDDDAVIPPRKRHAQNLRSPQNPDTADTSATRSPISSFTDNKVKRGQTEDQVLVAKKPQLHFVPLNEANLTRPPTKSKGKTIGAEQSMKSKADESEPPTSPIEDPSLIVSDGAPKKAKALTISGQPSKLQMEVQSRISKHATVNPRDKVMKLEKKDISSKPIGPNPTVSSPINESDIIDISSSPSSRATSPERTKPTTSKRVTKKEKSHTQAKGKAKEKPQRMTPAQYARWLMDSNSTSGRPQSTVFDGLTIFYTGGDLNLATVSTRKKMELIVSNGGNLVAEFDPTVTTHIVTETSRDLTLRALGLKRLGEIPEHIPTVNWNWAATALSLKGKKLSKEDVAGRLENLCTQHAAFASRMDAGIKKPTLTSLASLQARKKAKMQSAASRSTSDENLPGPSVQLEPASSDADNVEADRPFGPLLSPPTSPAIIPKKNVATSSKVTLDAQSINDRSEGSFKDPLAEYYPAVRAQLECNDSGWSTPGDYYDDESDIESERGALHAASRSFQKQGWTCDNKEPTQKKDCPNQDVIDKLTELMKLHEAKVSKDDHWRAFSYRKAIGALKQYPSRLKTLTEAKGLHGVGEKTARKIMEILETGDLRRIKYENTADVQSMALFRGIYGVGKTVAYQWYAAGCRTLDDLRTGKGDVKLSHVQKIGLEFYNDINDRMPREEAKAIFELIKPIALQLDSKLFIEIMGSYRRGSDDCGDIDILITRPTDDGLTHRDVLPKLLRDLHKAGILTDDLALPDDPHDLECTYRGLCHLPHVPGSKRRRIDFLSVPWKNRGGALLYYTGNDFFNRSMRLKARSMGYSLNQRGLYKVCRDTRGIKFDEGVLIASETEKEIFDILNIPWQTPSERVRG